MQQWDGSEIERENENVVVQEWKQDSEAYEGWVGNLKVDSQICLAHDRDQSYPTLCQYFEAGVSDSFQDHSEGRGTENFGLSLASFGDDTLLVFG